MESRQRYTFFIVLFASLLAFAKATEFINHESEVGLLSYMARSNDLFQQDPARSLSCFNKYIPLINEIAKNYETNYQACLNESQAASAKADEATLDQRNKLANAAEASCALLSQCPDGDSVEGIFQCYIDGGSANIQTMYSINANASQELADLKEQYYLIKNDEYKCTNATKREYEKDSAEAYAGLNNCILGNSDIVEENPSTEAPQESTAAPQESTEAPQETTTAEQGTSENPTTSSPAPESTASAPEESTIQNDLNPDEFYTEQDYFN